MTNAKAILSRARSFVVETTDLPPGSLAPNRHGLIRHHLRFTRRPFSRSDRSLPKIRCVAVFKVIWHTTTEACSAGRRVRLHDHRGPWLAIIAAALTVTTSPRFIGRQIQTASIQLNAASSRDRPGRPTSRATRRRTAFDRAIGSISQLARSRAHGPLPHGFILSAVRTIVMFSPRNALHCNAFTHMKQEGPARRNKGAETLASGQKFSGCNPRAAAVCGLMQESLDACFKREILAHEAALLRYSPDWRERTIMICVRRR